VKEDMPLPGMPERPRNPRRSHRLGYEAEHVVETYLTSAGYEVLRPRAGAARDKGDIYGLPIVISVKNTATPRLSGWLLDLEGMIENKGVATGCVWHKRRGRGSPAQWYVTMTGGQFMVFLRAYMERNGHAGT
jgi:hypothetical protein